LPLLLEYSLGNHATSQAVSPFGVFVGGGFGFNNLSLFQDKINMGPVGEAGIRFRLFKRDFAIRGAYQYAVSGFSTYNVGLLWGLNRNDARKSKARFGGGGGAGYKFRTGERWNSNKMKLSNMFGTRDRSNRRTRNF